MRYGGQRGLTVVLRIRAPALIVADHAKRHLNRLVPREHICLGGQRERQRQTLRFSDLQ
jgi:hypothetical protein